MALSTSNIPTNANVKESKGPPNACVFVAALSPHTYEESIINYFNQFGTVLKVKLLKDKNLRPYAFVQFLSQASAEHCLAWQAHYLDGRILRVERARVNRTLFLAKFGSELNATDLRTICQTYGEVETVTLKRPVSNPNKGCAFVKYQYREDASDAFLGLKGTKKGWVVEWATSANDPEQLGVDKTSIYVGGLSPDVVTEEMFGEYFQQHGEIESIILVTPKMQGVGQISTNSISGELGTFQPQEDTPSESHESPKSRDFSSLIELSSHLEGSERSKDDPNHQTSKHASYIPYSYGFIKYTTERSATSALEHEHGNQWLGYRLRVQYSETPEMKFRKKLTKQYKSDHGYQSSFSDSSYMPHPTMFTPLYPPNVHMPNTYGNSKIGYWQASSPSGTSIDLMPQPWYYSTPQNAFTPVSVRQVPHILLPLGPTADILNYRGQIRPAAPQPDLPPFDTPSSSFHHTLVTEISSTVPDLVGKSVNPD